MKVVHVSPSFFPAYAYGGPTESVYRLCCHLGRKGHNIRVLTTDANGPTAVLDSAQGREIEMGEGLHVRYCRRLLRHSVSPTLLRLLPSYIRWADVVHLTAVYSFPTIPTLLTCMLLGKPVVWSPRGSLQSWRGGIPRSIVKAVWDRLCRAIASERLILHVTSEEEGRESRERFPSIKAAVISNGVEVPEKVEHRQGNSVLRLLYLGRLHPKKAIENLLLACQMLAGQGMSPWSLTIVGAGDQSYTQSIRARIDELKIGRQVRMVGEVYGDVKQALFENVDIVVMPSHTENFGLVVAEALAHGVPVIASKGTPWKRIDDVGCGLWVDNDPESLAKALARMSRMPLREMGQRGRQWIQREFSWDERAKEMADLYYTISQRTS